MRRFTPNVRADATGSCGYQCVGGWFAHDEQESPTARIVDGMLNGRVLFLLSPRLLAEYRAVLLRPKLTALHGFVESEVERLLTELMTNALWCVPKDTGIAPDPNDDHLWALLDMSQPLLVTGDRLLLTPPNGRVVRPVEYVQGFATCCHTGGGLPRRRPPLYDEEVSDNIVKISEPSQASIISPRHRERSVVTHYHKHKFTTQRSHCL